MGEVINKYERFYEDETFFEQVVLGFLYYINNNVTLNKKNIRHYIINSGTDYLYIEGNKQDVLCQIPKEKIYANVPSCIIDYENIEIVREQMSSPYSRGNYQKIDKTTGELKEYNAEVKRVPVKIEFNCKYIFNNFKDVNKLQQKLIEVFHSVRYYYISYLGKEVKCMIKFPDNIDNKKNIEVVANADERFREINVTIELETNLPVYDELTDIDTNKQIRWFNTSVDGEAPEYDQYGTQIIGHVENDIRHININVGNTEESAGSNSTTQNGSYGVKFQIETIIPLLTKIQYNVYKTEENSYYDGDSFYVDNIYGVFVNGIIENCTIQKINGINNSYLKLTFTDTTMTWLIDDEAQIILKHIIPQKT